MDHPGGGQDLTHVREELSGLLGRRVERVEAAELRHNRLNAVTGGIWRVRADGLSAILKVLTAREQAERSGWEASTERSHWNYWRREALVYTSDLAAAYAPGNLRAPRLLAAAERPGGDIAVWLEDVTGIPLTGCGVGEHRLLAERLGHAQGAAARAGVPDHDWLSRGFLRDYLESKDVDHGALEDGALWAQPLVREHWPPGLQDGLRLLHAERERLLGLVGGCPRTLCHLDLWPANEVLGDDGSVILLDWAFAGDGALGEDVGNHVPDSVFDLFLPASALAELDAAMTAGYLEGLRRAGWSGDPRGVRLAICASAVKYDWIGPRMLLRAAEEAHETYGGTAVDPRRLYSERGRVLSHLVARAEEALRLAGELGV